MQFLKQATLSIALLMSLGILLGLSGCKPLQLKVDVKDQEWCGDKGELGAHCFHTLSDGTRNLTLAQWDVERFGKICTSSQNFADAQATLMKLCGQDRCSYEETQALEALGDRIKEYQRSLRR